MTATQRLTSHLCREACSWSLRCSVSCRSGPDFLTALSPFDELQADHLPAPGFAE